MRCLTDLEDVQQMALLLSEKNLASGRDLDRIFMQRKQQEQESIQVSYLMIFFGLYK
jgi:hypothetical protein